MGLISKEQEERDTNYKIAQKKWLAFIISFFGKEALVPEGTFSYGTTPVNEDFSIDNVLITGIQLSDRWGFLSIRFENNCKWNRADFQALADPNHNIFPCRSFGSQNGKYISYYASNEIEDPDGLFNSYVETFTIIMTTIVKLKIKGAVNN